MTGNNKLSINEATMIKMVQYYFDEVLFQSNEEPIVTSVQVSTTILDDVTMFDVCIREKVDGDDK